MNRSRFMGERQARWLEQKGAGSVVEGGSTSERGVCRYSGVRGAGMDDGRSGGGGLQALSEGKSCTRALVRAREAA